MTESVKVAVRDDNAGMIVMITLKGLPCVVNGDRWHQKQGRNVGNSLSWQWREGVTHKSAVWNSSGCYASISVLSTLILDFGASRKCSFPGFRDKPSCLSIFHFAVIN